MSETSVTVARSSLGVYGWGLALAGLLSVLLVLNNRHLLLDVPLHESGDTASNSLFVREAQSSVLTHGHYSRWNFYHPGPVLFYVYALGETLFYDWLHVVPAPYNGQVISSCLAVTLLFSLALMVFAQRLGVRRGGYAFFLPLALMFAVWHYGAANEAPAFVATWPACPLILVFLCFVVSAASVGSGGGRELPLLALTGGWLVHNYVAQPLFVLPMTLLAYGGLLVWCRVAVGGSSPSNWRSTVVLGWRVFPRAHLLAAAILALFSLPLLVDIAHGSESNFNRILAHLRHHQGPTHHLARSVCYFLTFGGYGPYNPAEDFFGRYSAGGMLTFVELHWRAYLGWVVALLATPWLFSVARRISAAMPRSVSDPETTASVPRDTFLRWFGILTVVAFLLTLVWGMRQDGAMCYFNAYFNFSIYFCVALGLAAALSAFLQAVMVVPHLRPARRVISVALIAAAGVVALSNAKSFENPAVVEVGGEPLAGVTTQLASETLPPGQICYLDWNPADGWGVATGIVLQLDRLGCQVRINDNWKIMFGQRHAFSLEDAGSDLPIVRWHIAPQATNPAGSGVLAVSAIYGVEVLPLTDLNPAGVKIRFAADGNWQQYACAGWTTPGGDSSWVEQPIALLQFRPLPLQKDDAAGVDMLIDGWSLTAPTAPTAQHVEIAFNGNTLPTVALPLDFGAEPVVVHLTGDLWRAACVKGFAKVMFRFPDARSPYALGINGDERKLGGGFRSIEFRPAR